MEGIKNGMELLISQMETLSISTNQVILTRLLYLLDEVVYMCLISMLKKDSDQSVFWFHELYYSGYSKECFKVIYTIYLLFYGYLNPKFDKYIQKNYKQWIESGDDKHLFNVVTNLIKCQYSFDVYLMYTVIKTNPRALYKEKVFKGRKPK